MNAAKQGLLERVEMPLSINDQMLRFLRAEFPSFTPPTDPAAWTKQARALRKKILRNVYLRGWPKELVDRQPPIVWGETLKPHKDYVIRKLRYEICPDYWVPALLYVPTAPAAKTPVVLCPNGHHGGGKAVQYKQARCANLARRGMLVMNYEFLGMGELGGDWPHSNRGFVDMTGISFVGFFYMAMSKALDILLAQPNADPKRCAMTGLSGGGWQTIVLSALDERITHSIPVAGYMSMKLRLNFIPDIGDYEQLPPDLGLYGDYQLLTAMVAPRPMLQILNERDECCFRTDRAKKDIHDDLRCVWQAYGAGDDFVFYNNTDPGTHNYDADSRSQLYRFLNKHFHLETPVVDIHTPNEILPELTLNVGLPDEQSSILGITRRRARKLINKLKLPRTAGQKVALRKKLAEKIRLCSFTVRATPAGSHDGAKLLRLNMGGWELPAAVVRASDEKRCELVLADSPGAGEQWTEISARGTVVWLDVLGTGTCKGEGQFRMCMQAAGQQVLGLAVGQVLAAARFAAKQAGTRRVNLVGDGWIASAMAHVAAALEPKLFESLTLNVNFNSFIMMLDQCFSYGEIQPLIVPDILTICDFPQLTALLEDMTFRQPSRAVPEMKCR